MVYIQPGGASGGASIWDSLAQFYISVAIIWTTAIIVGASFLLVNRREQCIRIRNLPLALSAVLCLHIYWVLCMSAYSMNGSYPCAAEYWIMSIYFPLGIALFQANSMQLLSVFGIQEKLLLTAHQPYKPNLGRSKSPSRFLSRWRHMSLVQRTEVGIAVGMVLQVILSLSIYLTSRKFESFGTWDTHVNPQQCRRGPEWIPSILWQLFWSWIFAPYILWKIRKIYDIHHWRLQITCVVVAALPGSPLWFAALYSSSSAWASINRYWVPALWFAPGIMAMEAVTIFIPCYELIVSRRQRDRTFRAIEAWSKRKQAGVADESDSGTWQSERSAASSSARSTRSELYSRKALEKCLAEDTNQLLQFAASKEFSGENIIFLNYVRDWKAAWVRVNAMKPGYDWEQDPESQRLHLYKVAVEIYASCINLKTAEFPINIESQIYSDLTSTFGDAAKLINQGGVAGTPTFRNVPESYNMAPTKKRSSTVIVIDEDTRALCLDDNLPEGQSIMHIEPRVPDHVSVPVTFTISAFDAAEKSIKGLVYTNTWPKFIDSSSSSDVSIDIK